MRSGSGISAALVALGTFPVAVMLSGCVTTQQIAARARLVDARIRASQNPLHVTERNPDVRVTRLSLVRGRGGTAVAVELIDTSRHALTDLPISVGVTTPTGRKLYLNGSANLDYFDTHVVAVPPRTVATWVFTNGRQFAAGRPFADVGVSQLSGPGVGTLPRIDITPALSASESGARSLSLSVSNLSDVPQYSLPVYAVGVRNGRVLAAGRASVAHLGTQGRATVRLTLLGRALGTTVRLSALPTIFQ